MQTFFKFILGFLTLPLVSTSSLAATNAIAPGQITNGTISASGQINWYSFSGSSNDFVTITICRTNGVGRPYFELYNSDGLVAAASWGGAVAFLEGQRLPATGTYTLMVREVALNQTLGYELSFIKLRCSANLREAGDAPETIQPGQSTGGHIDSVADLDTYCFDAISNELVTISIFRTNGSGLPYFQLYNSEGYVAESPFGDSLEFVEDLRLPRTGPYTLLIRDVSITETLGYAFTFARIPVSSPVLQSNEEQSGTISLGEMDAYSFYAIAGNSITLRLEKTSGPGQTYMRVYGPGPSFLKDGYQHIQLTCLDETGYYTVLVRDVGANEPLAYDLSMLQTPIIPPSSGLTQYLGILACSTNIILRWHTNSTGFALETSPIVTSPPDHPPAIWTPVTTPPQIVADYFYVNEASIPDQARFYRLKCTNCPSGP